MIVVPRPHFIRRPVLLPAYVNWDDEKYDAVLQRLRDDEALRFVTFIDGSVPGSQSITTEGSGSFSVPLFATLAVTLWGGGGGGAGANNATAGGSTTFGVMTAGGGAPGRTSYRKGLGGTASGGDTNTTGGDGGSGSSGSGTGGDGGDAPGGGAGGNGATNGNNGGTGNAPGGGGGGVGSGFGADGGGGGGSGAKCYKLYTPGMLTPGDSQAVTVGAHGPKGSGTKTGGDGARGQADFSWT